jgi:hypothetical protein
MTVKVAESTECTVRAWMAELDAHSQSFAGDVEAAKASVRLAIAAHRDAINLLVASLPDALEEFETQSRKERQGSRS